MFESASFSISIQKKRNGGSTSTVQLEGFVFFSVCHRGFMKFLSLAKECRPGVLVCLIQTVSVVLHPLFAHFPLP